MVQTQGWGWKPQMSMFGNRPYNWEHLSLAKGTIGFAGGNYNPEPKVKNLVSFSVEASERVGGKILKSKTQGTGRR